MVRLPEELLEADELVLDAADILLDSLGDFPSLVGFDRLHRVLDKARKTAAGTGPATAGERLTLFHLDANWSALEAVARYQFEWPRTPIEEPLAAIAGKGALDRLEQVVAGIDQQAAWTYLELRQSFRPGRVPPDLPDARPFLEDVTRRMTGEFRSWLRDREGEVPGLDAEVVLAPGASARSYYDPAMHRVVLGAGEFMVFGDRSGLRVDPVLSLYNLAHELAGHAMQDALSRGLPAPLRPDHRGRLRYASLPIAEGFADHRGGLALEFAEESGEAIGLTERDLDFLRLVHGMGTLHHAVPACLDALAARARQEPRFDAVAHLAKLAGHPGFGQRVAPHAAPEPLNRVLYNAACHFGRLAVEGAAKELARRGVTGSEAVRRLGTGGWALACYTEAVLEG